MPIQKVTLLDFDGSGDIYVGASGNKVFFVPGEPSDIGAITDCYTHEVEIIMEFTKPESIDVVIARLQDAKENLRNAR